MNLKHNLNYFKKSDNLKFIGMGLIVIGLLMLLFGWSYITYIIMALSIPSGFVLFIIGSSGRSSDSDIESDIKSQLDGLIADFEKDKKRGRKQLKNVSPSEIAGNCYTDDVMLTKAKNSSVRSSDFAKSVIYFLNDELYIIKRTVSVIENNIRNSEFDIEYSKIEKVEITREKKVMTSNKRKFNVSIVMLQITYDNGQAFTSPIHDDIDADQLVEKINKQIDEYNKSTNV